MKPCSWSLLGLREGKGMVVNPVRVRQGGTSSCHRNGDPDDTLLCKSFKQELIFLHVHPTLQPIATD